MARWNLVAISSLVASTACNPDPQGDGGGTGDGNNVPVADAGGDANVSAAEIVPLDGCGSYDPDGDAITFAWSFDHVPGGSALGNPDKNPFPENYTTTCDTSFIPDTVGTFVVKLIITDNRNGVSAPDYVVITIDGGNKPVANAGPDQIGAVAATFMLDGTASFDGAQRPLTYAWAMTNQPAGSAASLSDSSSVAPSFVADVPGLYTVALVVDNGVLVSEPDAVSVTAMVADPQAPIADAGLDVTGEDCTAIPLNGSDSEDPDGSALVYSWALQAKPKGSSATNEDIADRGAEITTFYPDIAGDYTISLAVFDGKSWSTPDTVAIHAIERVLNTAPLVYAGANQTFLGGTAKCTEGTYGYDCDECPPVTELLGSDATITDGESDPYDILWELVAGEATIDEPYVLTTLVTMAGFAPETPTECLEQAFTFKLNATDCPQATSSDEVTFTVSCCGVAAP